MSSDWRCRRAPAHEEGGMHAESDVYLIVVSIGASAFGGALCIVLDMWLEDEDIPPEHSRSLVFRR
jgi:hypothetical protein